MKLKVINSENYQSVIEKCYATDTDLLKNYHALAPTTFESAVSDTVNILQKSKDIGTLKLYEIHKDNNLIAYFGIDRVGEISTLSGFFIMPGHRNKEFVSKFWKIVKSKMPKTFFCAIYQKNQRAISFLKKRGFNFFGSAFIPTHNLVSDIYKFN